MLGRTTSGAADSVITSTSGYAVEPDTNFTQPITSVEFIITRIPVMSESKSHSEYFSGSRWVEKSIASDVRLECTDASE